MAASLAKSFSRLFIHAPNVPQLLAPLKIKQHVTVQQFSSFRNPTMLMRQQYVPPAFKISSLLVNRSLLHTTTVCATTPERKEWREIRVINRFYRLHWGGWIRTFGGRYKQLYLKTSKERWRLKQHVFCNRKQSERLDRYVTETWRKPKYNVDTPYEIYHNRINCSHFPNNKKFYP